MLKKKSGSVWQPGSVTETEQDLACRLQLSTVLAEARQVPLSGQGGLQPVQQEWLVQPGFKAMPDEEVARPQPERKWTAGRIVKAYGLRPVYKLASRLAPGLAEQLKHSLWRRRHRSELDDNGGRPRLLVDTTYFTTSKDRGGIYRLCHNVDNELLRSGAEVALVRVEHGMLWTNPDYVATFPGQPREGKFRPIKYNRGDVLFLLDPSWGYREEFRQVLRELRAAGGKSFAIIHDIFPLQYPEFFGTPSDIAVFREWHEFVLESCDGIICDSRATADNVAAYARQAGLSLPSPTQLFYFPLGAVLPDETGEVRQELRDFFRSGSPVFLMVGTIEPRKGHEVAVRAFQRFWQAGGQARLLMLGHDGWRTTSFKELLRSVPGLGQELVWIRDASDAELVYCYRHASCLLAASRDEGFGLPLVEAAQYGLPLLCSDIPVFREVSQGRADFFPVFDVEALSKALADWLAADEHPDPQGIRICSWQESTEVLLCILRGESKPYKVLE